MPCHNFAETMDNNLGEWFLAKQDEGKSAGLKTRVWIESKIIWRIAFPSMLARVTAFGMVIVTQSFLGHIGEVELATYALIQSILVRFVNGVLIGMSSATETLCGQAFGAEHYHMMGIYLQRSWIVDGATATILVPLFLLATPLLRLLGQEEQIAKAAGTISLWFIPMLYNMVFSLTIQMYLQAQLKNLVVGWLSTASFLLHLLLSWLMVYKLNWGVSGAMGALNISSWAMVIGEFVYIFGGWCPHTWKGFTKAAFYDLMPVVKLSVASGLMICLELWYNAILVLLAGYMKNATISIDAFSICVRVANELGRGNAKAVKFSIKTILGTSISFGVFFWILCLVFGHRLSYLFTTNEEVAKAVSSLSTLLAFSILLNSVQPVLSGVATGAGMQSTVAIVNLGCYYAVGIPVGVVLGYVLDFEVRGLWVGLLSGVVLQTVILSVIVWRTDWEEQPKHFGVSQGSPRLLGLLVLNLGHRVDRAMDDNLEQRFLAQPQEEDKTDLKRRVWIETKTIWRVAFPGMLSRVTSFGMIVVTQSFLGHIGEVELATYALVQSVFVRFINGILIGMSSATETLCGQAFGAGQYHMMGIYLQRSWIVDGITATILLPVFFFATPIFKLLGQEDEIADAAGPISLWFIPMLYYMVFGLTIQMYLQAQLKNLVVGCLSAAAFVLHLLLSWIFVYKLNWGLAGAMGSLNICSWAMVFGEFVFIFGGWCPNSWKGFSKAAFYDLLPIVKLSLASGFMICLELWYNAILVLLAGYMKNATIAIAAFSICLNVNAWEFMICLGLYGASIVRVANELGRGNAKAVKFAIKTIMSTSICIGMVFFVLCLVFGRQISYMFTSVAIGSGFQSMVAFVNLGCYYAVGLPLGAVLGYLLHLEVVGLWIGLLGGVALQTFIVAIIVWRTDWDEQVKKASERLNRWLIKPEEEDNQSPPQA
ncbi:hypothetical protein POUND7_000714 [Theobroma cacao]